MTAPLIILSAGGTGGHMTPAAALGYELLALGFRVEIITDERGRKFESMFTDMRMHVVPAGTLGGGIAKKIKGIAGLIGGTMRAVKIMKHLKPAVVVGFGGYPSVPGVYAAQHLKIPTVLHEQNATLGKANNLLVRRAKRIALSWPNTRRIQQRDASKCVVTGNPVRADIAALHTQPYPRLAEDGEFKIFVMGGSLGAKVFGEVVPRAFAMLPADQRSRLSIAQQCRVEQLAFAQNIYKEAGIKASLGSFFENVPDLLTAAHLVICRSGASTVAEVAAAGRPAIFVPYPHHKDQQQKVNADALSDIGGGWTMLESTFTAEALLARIQGFLQNPSALATAAENARSLGKPDAARLLGNVVTELVIS